MNAPTKLAAGIRLAVFDVDGVMTDGRLYLSDDGHETKAFHSRDGLGLKALMRLAMPVAVITARTSRLVTARMTELGIEHVFQGREDKRAALGELCAQLNLERAQVCYTGDDLVDWPVMRDCGLRCAPADADAWIRDRVDYITRARAGRGAVREVCELLLAGHGRLEAFREGYA